LTPQHLLELIQSGETLDIEFKGESRKPLSDDELIETVVCLANRASREPGWLLIGVEDDGTVTGSRPRHDIGRTDPLRLTALISNRTRPSITVRVVPIMLGEHEVLAIEVPACTTPVGTTAGKYLRRTLGGDGLPSCVPMYFHEMQSRQGTLGIEDFSALEVPGANWDDLDPLEFERFRRSIRETRVGDASLLTLSDLDLAKALGAVVANGTVSSIRVLAVLLFGRLEAVSRFVPTNEVAFQLIRDRAVVVNDFFRYPLIRAMEECQQRFRAHLREQEIMHGLLRIGIPDYPSVAYREALANALVHRDYTRLGAVHSQWHADHLEISSPGGFPEGVRLDNLLVTSPRPRNPLLADAFKRAGIVERTARGIDTIFFEQLRNGRPAPSYARSNETSVVVLLPGGKANLEFVRLIVEESSKGNDLGLDDLLLLNSLWVERSFDTAEAAALIQKPEAEARASLNRLKEIGLVESRGERKGRTWHLSAATYARMGMQTAYVRQRGFEPIQQEQMVLQFVRKNGSIRNSDAQELCRVNSDQAYYLLSRLVADGRLVRSGSTKDSTYILP
jgi:ATP-dependent DNA helicase RecG